MTKSIECSLLSLTTISKKTKMYINKMSMIMSMMYICCFFSKKNILIPNVAEKNILILVEEKKNNLIQSFCHIT
jgi:hypothetical protein